MYRTRATARNHHRTEDQALFAHRGAHRKKQWLGYFGGIRSTSENQGSKSVNTFDSTSALVELVEKVLIAADGYPQVCASLTATPDWQRLLPLSHRLAVGHALTSVERGEEPDDSVLTLGAEAVYLNAVWGADEHGVLQKYRGLCHRFKTPSSEQQRRVSRDASRSRIIGGSRKGTTVWLGAQATLAEIYDELILGVDGYMVKGVELNDDRDAITASMDTYHKVMAADVLFSPAVPNISEDE